MSAGRASVIVVSRGRPEALKRCLLGLSQLDHPAFEVIVVADPAGLSAASAAGYSGRIKAVAFDRANISQARNLGISQAAADIVAFIDDDAVPEPTWLRRLVAPFADACIDATGGYVRASNGISFQNRANLVDTLGRAKPLPLADDTARKVAPPPGLAVKTEGTNCAFRVRTLRALGGFDPGFRFYLDETDVNMRLAAAGGRTVIVPLAQVHHGFAASARRDRSRMPRDLTDVGSSSARFLRKHAEKAETETVFATLQAEQKARLLRHMVRGNCEPSDVALVLNSLRRGWQSGLDQDIAAHALTEDPPPIFTNFAPLRPMQGDRVLAGRSWRAGRWRAEAAALVRAGHRVSLYLFSPTARYHTVRFTADGVWEQTGGLFGRSDRRDPLFAPTGFRVRVAREAARVAPLRHTDRSNFADDA